jgi:hypothetical protein
LCRCGTRTHQQHRRTQDPWRKNQALNKPHTRPLNTKESDSVGVGFLRLSEFRIVWIGSTSTCRFRNYFCNARSFAEF